MIASPIETGIGIAIILTGVPVYFIFIAWKNKPMWVQKMSEGFTKFMQKMFVVLPPNKPKSPSTNEIKSAAEEKVDI
jgi:solute carrier family 7 L-type amino acid transporter-like protein